MTDRVARRLNQLSDPEARAALIRCCGSQRWVDRMLEQRPFATDATVFAAADRTWWKLGRVDWLDAFAAHPRIGEPGGDAWTRREQSGAEAAGAATRRSLAEGNRTYEQRFGHVFLICATGRNADEMLADLRQRLGNDPEAELRIAAGEQAKITRLRLEKLVTP